MKLTVVGCSPAWPNPGSAHSGYLVEGRGTLLLECGTGVLSKLRLHEGWPQVDSIVISHWHLDHWGDLVPWVWGSMFGLGKGSEIPELWIPPGGTEELARFGALAGTPMMFTQAFRLAEYEEGVPFTTAAGPTITATRVPHYTMDAFALRITEDGTTLAFSGDSAPTDALAEVARDADLFLCEATLADDDPDHDPRGHLTAEEAVAAFTASGAKRLLLTHRPQELAVGDGLEVAQEGLELDL